MIAGSLSAIALINTLKFQLIYQTYEHRISFAAIADRQQTFYRFPGHRYSSTVSVISGQNQRLCRLSTCKFTTESKQLNQTVSSEPNQTSSVTKIRQVDYRRDFLTVEKALGLVGMFTFKEAYSIVIQGRISVNGQVAAAGHLVSRDDVLFLDNRPLPQRQVNTQALYMYFTYFMVPNERTQLINHS
jgi:hypothetical protein